MSTLICSRRMEVIDMPIYEYQCDGCNGRFEVNQKFSDPLLTVCALCGAPSVRKMLSTPSFVLKGGGWYVTDHPSDARKKGTDSEKPCGDAKPAAGCPGGACAAGACAAKG